MKQKILLFMCVVSILCLSGCNSSTKNKELLYGEWSYLGKSGFDDAYFYYIFNEDGTFTHAKCMGYGDCRNGDAKWSGNYKLKGNRIELKVENEEQIISRYGFNIDIEDSLIVDFDNMYICDGTEGLDCSDKYEKDN